MFLRLYSEHPPAYRALLFIVALKGTTTLTSEESTGVGMRLFDNQYSKEAPLLVPIKPSANLTELTRICHEAGIVMEALDT